MNVAPGARVDQMSMFAKHSMVTLLTITVLTGCPFLVRADTDPLRQAVDDVPSSTSIIDVTKIQNGNAILNSDQGSLTILNDIGGFTGGGSISSDLAKTTEDITTAVNSAITGFVGASITSGADKWRASSPVIQIGDIRNDVTVGTFSGLHLHDFDITLDGVSDTPQVCCWV